MGLFSKSAFYKTVDQLGELPNPGGKEVAFAGRSNAGKSSAINALADRTRLAYTSKTPGRTQHINYFSLGNNCFLVDLPGYGYARVPPPLQRHWENLVSQYLQKRAALCGLVVIMDARHPLTPLDGQLLAWFAPTGKPVHVLLTKSDKLSRQQASLTLRQVTAYLNDHYPNASAQLFSSLKKAGLEQVESVLAEWLGQKNVPG